MAEPIRIVGGGTNEGVQATLRKLTNAVPQDVSMVDSAGSQITPIALGTTMGNGNKDVATAGTAVALAGATTVKRVWITGKAANTNKIYIGGSTVDSSNGTFIYASQTIVIDIDDLAEIYIDADTSTEGVQYSYVT
jgi:hypothetical protein